MSRQIDWSKAGKRLRHTPRPPSGNNPDWNWREDRWKTAEEYAGEELDHEGVAALVACSVCGAIQHVPCIDARGRAIEAAHPARIAAAGAVRIEQGWKL